MAVLSVGDQLRARPGRSLMSMNARLDLNLFFRQAVKLFCGMIHSYDFGLNQEICDHSQHDKIFTRCRALDCLSLALITRQSDISGTTGYVKLNLPFSFIAIFQFYQNCSLM